ncbi:aquaporin AQPAn.G [Fopius arisanus]|uniref:Aquaporin AQPAn.G n=1 Tax=Fopius arisanus TaxID=64838 RepID=A0A9R1TS55_9HYME|nr:PREDICTED: aquaporin AQPAn.G [Fopius arisanus]
MAGLKAALGLHELKDPKANLYRALLAEFLGTMLLNFFGCGAVYELKDGANYSVTNRVAIALSFGLVVAGAVQAIGHVSGGHINPAVTCGLLVIGKVPVVRAILYIIAQSTGAIAGSAAIRALSSQRMESAIGVVSLSPGMTPVQGMGIEFFLGLILVIVVCGACDGAKPESKGIAPLIIGLAVTVGHIVGIPRTGSGMNPARALGSSVVMGHFDNHWLYWVGPILGGMAGGLVYTHALGPAKIPEDTRTYAVVAGEEKELQRLTRKGQPA